MKLAAITSLLLVGTGCVATDDDRAPVTGSDTETETDSDSDPQPEDDSQPEPEPEPEPESVAPIADGAYAVRSQLDLTVEALLPEQIYSMVLTLRQFSQNPAQTMFDVAEDAGVPAVEEIRDNLPDYVEDKLEGWINGELAKITVDGKSLAQHAGDLAALAETSVGKFAIDSTLAVDGSTATHALSTLDLTPAGIEATFSLTALPGEVTTATATCASNDGTFTIGEHGYSIPYGEYVWQAINARIDVRASLGAAVNCPALAHTISNKCYWGYCVGHEPELTEICERGLDEIVERVHDKFAATRLDLVHFASGTAQLADDGNAMTGSWSAQVNAGQGLRDVPATFTATR